MSKVALALTVDGWEAMGDVAPTYSAGEPVTGTVHVWVHDEVQCDGLDVELVPVRTSRGFALGLELPRVRIFEGNWAPGEYDIPFSVKSHWLPTYRGKLGWSWVVRATADIPWASDPGGESTVEIVWPAPPNGVEVAPLRQTQIVERRRPMRWILLIFLGIGLALLASALTAYVFELAHEDLIANLSGFGFTSCLVAFMIYSAGSKGRGSTSDVIERVMVNQRDGGGGAYRGDGAYCLDVEACASADLSEVKARLVVEEYAEWTETRNETTTTHRRHHVHHEREVPMTQASDGTWRGSIPLPEPSTVPCFSIGSVAGYGIVWRVDLESHRSGRTKSDLTQRYLTVRPRLP